MKNMVNVYDGLAPNIIEDHLNLVVQQITFELFRCDEVVASLYFPL